MVLPHPATLTTTCFLAIEAILLAGAHKTVIVDGAVELASVVPPHTHCNVNSDHTPIAVRSTVVCALEVHNEKELDYNGDQKDGKATC